MYGNMFDMWSSCSYKMTKDLDVSMNPYGKDAYGNYRIGDNTKRKKDNNPDKLVHPYPDPIYEVGDVNMWCLENNEIVVGRIVKVYPASDVVSGERINRYAINVLVDGIYSNNDIYVTEDMVIESLDADTYSNTHKIGEHNDYGGFNPLNTTSDRPANTDFKCDIDDLKMDINDLRTDVKSLLESQYKIEGDLMVAKKPEIGLSIDDTLTSDIRDIKESGERLDSTVNYCVDELGVIREELNEVNHKTKKASNLSKLSLLGNLVKFL